MSTPRQTLLRANAAFLLAASAGGFCSDVLGIFFGLGPVAKIVAAAPYSGLGFIEAHGLAFLIGLQLWRAEPSRAWHLTAAAIQARTPGRSQRRSRTRIRATATGDAIPAREEQSPDPYCSSDGARHAHK